MLKITERGDLERLIHDEIQESLTLDYKASPALTPGNEARRELIKDVSAFANSAGGQIIYGVVEKDRKPVRIDDGVDGEDVSREWIEQVIDSNVQPRIEGLVITPIKISEGKFAYILEIPQAVARAPHQAMDGKYYKRQNFQSVPMEDYEIRDIFRRASNAEPFLHFSFVNGQDALNVEIDRNTGEPLAFALDMQLGNRSAQPAYYTVVQLYTDIRFIVENAEGFEQKGTLHTNVGDVNIRVRKFGIPGSFPLFKEMNFAVCVPPLSLRLPMEYLDQNLAFPFGYELRSPGHHVVQWALMRLSARRLQLDREKALINS